MEKIIQKDDPLIVAIYEHNLKEQFIKTEFSQFSKGDREGAKKGKIEIKFSDKTVRKEVLYFYVDMLFGDEKIDIKGEESFESKFLSHIEKNIDNYLSGQTTYSNFICSVIQIVKNIQRCFFNDLFFSQLKRGDQPKIFVQLLIKAKEYLRNKERKSHLILLILKILFLRFPFMIFYDKTNLLKNFDIVKKFQSYPGNFGNIGSEMFDLFETDIYLPGYSLFKKLLSIYHLDKLIEDKNILQLPTMTFNRFVFMSNEGISVTGNKPGINISLINNYIKKKENLVLSSVLGFLLIILNLVDDDNSNEKERFNYIYSIMSKGKNCVKLLKEIISLVQKTMSFEKEFFVSSVKKFNRAIKKSNTITQGSINAFTDVIELSQYFKPFIIMKQLNDFTNLEIIYKEGQNELNTYLQNVEYNMKIILYENDFDVFIEKIQDKIHLANKISIYLIPEKDNYIINNYSIILSKSDVLYNNLIYIPFTTINSTDEHNEFYLSSIKGNFNLFLTEANNILPIYFYTIITSMNSHVIYKDKIQLCSHSQNSDISLDHEMEVFQEGKLAYSRKLRFSNIIITTKNICYTDRKSFEASLINSSEYDMNIKVVVNDKKVHSFSGDKFVIRSLKNEANIVVECGLNEREVTSKFSIEGIRDERKNHIYLSLKTFTHFTCN